MLRRTLFAALAVTGVITLPAVPAGATTPRVEQGSFTFPVDEFDTDLCGFPIRIQSQATIRFTSFLDAQGNPQRLILHLSIDEGTFSANGVSLEQGSNHNTTTVLFDTSGNPITSTFVGSSYRCFSPARSS
jgi:hypothetical protein